MDEKRILSLLIGQNLFSNKELKEVASKAFNTKFLKEFDELNIKLPEDPRENERFSDEGGDDASEISMDAEETTRLKKLEEKYKKDALKPVGKNLFQKSQFEDENYDDFDDYEGATERTETTAAPRGLAMIQPLIVKNPYENYTVSQILSTIGEEKGSAILKFSELYLPTTKEHKDNVQKYLYKYLIRDPKDLINVHKAHHGRIVVFEKEILRMFNILYEQNLSMRAEDVEAEVPQSNITIVKDTIKHPTAYNCHPLFSPLNSAGWFDSLESDLLRNMSRENEIEVEMEPGAKHNLYKEPGHEGTGSLFGQVGGPPKHNFQTDKKDLHTLGSSKRVANGQTDGHGGHASVREKNNLRNDLNSLFDAGTPVETPNREDGGDSPNKSEDNQFGEDSPARSKRGAGISVYNRSLNNNMREYLNEHYDQDRRALFSFYTGLKGQDQADRAVWGEMASGKIDQELEERGLLGNFASRRGINYNYTMLPFRNRKEGNIFKYQSDVQDTSEVELPLLHKKRRLDKDEVKIKVGMGGVASLAGTYYNKNVLEASWNDFFFENRAKLNKREKEYSMVLIDLNDKSLFYDKIHTTMLGVQKADKKVRTAEDIQEQANIPGDQRFENMPEVDIDTQGLNIGAGRGVSGAVNAPSETDSVSVSRKEGLGQNINKMKKDKLKALRISAVKIGLNPDELTIDNARDLLGRPSKTDSKIEGVTLPPILKTMNDLKKKVGSSAVIQHSKVANEFQFNEFHIKRQDYEQFHKPDIRRTMDPRNFHPWRIEIIKSEDNKKDKEAGLNSMPDDPFEVNELVDSFEYFKNHRRLSLREGKFALFEYIEENPLIMSNVGMASRINRYVYPQRAYTKFKTKGGSTSGGDEEKELTEFKVFIKETLGSHGSINFMDEKQSIPLIGQLTNDKFIGITILENNLYYAPIFVHKAPETDFVLVTYSSSDGSKKHYLRKIDYIYTVGQIEPKVEVFNPSCRSLTSFIRKSIKHVIKKKFGAKESVHMEEMKQLFPTVNDHNMKKLIQYYGGDADPENNKVFFYNKDLDHDLIDEEKNEGDITAEEVCQYERMHASNVRLKNIGLEDLRSCDKINTIRNRYLKRNNLKIWNEETGEADKRNFQKMNLVANYCSEELQLTAWNLSQSFLSSKQKQGRLFLTGFGDPTSGHGGYSYVKLPLKTSRYEKEEKKNNASKLSQVTGTEADLRKLPIKHVDDMIKNYSQYKEEHISKLSRWDKIDLLRQIANEHPDNEELMKYARAFRMTTKMQREKYQKDINNLFMTLVENLGKKGGEEIQSDDEGEFECHVSQLVDKELEETMRKMPKDLNQAEEMARIDGEGDGDGDGDGDDGGDPFDF